MTWKQTRRDNAALVALSAPVQTDRVEIGEFIARRDNLRLPVRVVSNSIPQTWICSLSGWGGWGWGFGGLGVRLAPAQVVGGWVGVVGGSVLAAHNVLQKHLFWS